MRNELPRLEATSPRPRVISGEKLQKTILVIEDDGMLRDILSRTLRGYNVIAVGSLSEGRAVIVERQVEIDLILSDIELGEDRSPTLHAEVQPIIQARNIRWLSMTGYASKEDLDYYRTRGIQIVDKPFDRATIRLAVEQALARP